MIKIRFIALAMPLIAIVQGICSNKGFVNPSRNLLELIITSQVRGDGCMDVDLYMGGQAVMEALQEKSRDDHTVLVQALLEGKKDPSLSLSHTHLLLEKSPETDHIVLRFRDPDEIHFSLPTVLPCREFPYTRTLRLDELCCESTEPEPILTTMYKTTFVSDKSLARTAYGPVSRFYIDAEASVVTCR